MERSGTAWLVGIESDIIWSGNNVATLTGNLYDESVNMVAK